MNNIGVFLFTFIVALVQECGAGGQMNASAQTVAMLARQWSSYPGQDQLRIIVTQNKMEKYEGQRKYAAAADLKTSLQNVVKEHISKMGLQTSSSLRGEKGAEKVEAQTTVTMHRQVGVAVVSVPLGTDDATLQNIISAMMSVENVRSVEADVYVELIDDIMVDDDEATLPELHRQETNLTTEAPLWGMDHIGTRTAHLAADLPVGFHRPLVVISDTGVQLNHPDLQGNMFVNSAELNGEPGVDDDGNGYIDDIYGWNALNATVSPADDIGHGTHVAGTVGAIMDNGIGVYGAHGGAIIVPCKFLGPDGGWISGAIECIDYSIAVKAYISNNSYVGSNTNGLRAAIERARDFGQLYVAAAGNSGGAPYYPAAYSGTHDNVLAVASIDRYDKMSSFSCYDPEIVQVAAPGSSIRSTCTGNRYCNASGTSMACPHVAGAAALLKSMRPTWTYTQIREAIERSAKPFVFWDELTKYGCLDLAGAVDNILHGSTTTTPATTTSTGTLLA